MTDRRSDRLSPDTEEARGGVIAYMVRNGVAANLLMIFVFVAGTLSLMGLVQELFPEASLDHIEISVAYPGATPEEIDESIVRRIEEQIKAVDGVKEIEATAGEGHARVFVELRLGEDDARIMDELKAEVDRIQSFPAGAERPLIRELTNRQSVIRVALFGDVPERSLKELAREIETDLSSLPEIAFVQVTGVRDYEISIEVPSLTLRSLGLTLADVSAAVRRGSLDLSAGSIETDAEEVRVRTTGQNYTQRDFEEIVVLSRMDGTVVRLGDIARVRDGFQEANLITRYQGQPVAFVEVFRTADERVLDIVEAVDRHLQARVVPALPAGVRLDVWSNDADVLRDRLGLLVENGLLGLILVLLALTFFLEIRLAFWVAIGIAMSFVGTFAIMLALGASINMLSLFGFILAIGIVVDDAIIVGENIHSERERGVGGLQAAIRGTLRIRRPVVFAVVSTVVAFCPMFFVPSALGQMIQAIPVVVISVLGLSLVESLLVLPHHLSHLPRRDGATRNPVLLFFRSSQKRVDVALKRFVDGPLDRALRFTTRRPDIVLATTVALIVVSLATIPAGIVQTEFLPAVETDIVTATLEMPEGTPVERTAEVTRRLEAAGHRAVERLSAGRPPDAEPLLSGVNVTVGLPARVLTPGGDGLTIDPRGNIAAVEFKLLSGERREIPSAEFQRVWRDEMGDVPEASSLVVTAEFLDFGSPVEAQISHAEPGLLRVVGDELVARLRELAGVYDVRTDQNRGFKEIQLELKPEAHTLGLTLDGLARQVRSAFFGDEALRVQRGPEDLRVYVRLPEEERDAIADVERYRVRTPAGDDVPLDRVAVARLGHSPASIHRKDGRRVLTLQADVDPAIVPASEVNERLRDVILPELAIRHPGLEYTFGGEREAQFESFGALGRGYLLALVAIYALLAIPFGSYSKPLIVMAAVPSGIVGAILGHLLLDLELGMMSVFGIVGLSGVVVNDSLVMIDFINERMAGGMPARNAIIEGAKVRFRPIFLTSVTTFLGVSPLVFEKSVQAQILTPMAASLGFGIVFATAILMLVVPALAMVHHRVVERIRAHKNQRHRGLGPLGTHVPGT